ncbi:tudor domain-containing protein 6 [Esox lucius]|uniref:tudor domain-containing protein 6 n=1 Tax=Esox lucius TaxID=8010 RepID=UPI001476C694|nr:tudor domain-containing protein 6 [Esox lucius]
MCSIPGLPIPGSQVSVLITRVNLNPICALVELWGNFFQERRNAYQQMRKEIQISIKMFFKSEGNPGDLCLAHLNETWHRARIISKHEQRYNVFLIDEGIYQVASSNALAWGQKECFTLPAEVEFCVLANVFPLSHETKWTPSASDFLESLCGKTFSGMVQDILPDRTVLLYIPTVNRHMYEVGFARNLHSEKFKQLVISSLNLPKSKALLTKAVLPTVSQEQTEMGREQNETSRELEQFQQYFYPELLANSVEIVEVTEVINPQRIFCRLSIFSKSRRNSLNRFMNIMKEIVFLQESPQVSGTPCTARGSNGQWYRSLLQQDIGSDSTVVEVLHVDSGKTDFVHVSNIRLLAAKFLRFPVVTYVCSLQGIKNTDIGWTVDEIEYLKSLLLHQTVIAKFQYMDLGINYVTLYREDNVNINNLFKGMKRENLVSDGPPTQVKVEQISSEIQDCESPSPDSPSATEAVLNANLLQVGSILDIKVSFIESPTKFWCQIAQESTSLKILMQDIQHHYASTPPQKMDEDICVALNPDDGKWYRAQIIRNCQLSHVDVRYIDYGRTKRVSLKDLRPLEPVFRRLNPQAFQCYLQNLTTPTSPFPIEWSDTSSFEFQNLVDSNVSLKCTIKAVMNDPQGFMVTMLVNETPFKSAFKLLVQKGVKAPAPMKPPLSHALPKTYNFSLYNIEVGTKEKVWITSVKSIDQFYGQLERNSAVIDKLTKDLQHLCHQPKQSAKCPQSLEAVCIAKYTDMQWYRGQIKATHPIIQVNFVDYGNTAAVSQSDILPWPVEGDLLMSVPVQAVLFGLNGVPGHVSQKVHSWFEQRATNQSVTFKVVGKDSGGKLLVELYDGTIHINEKVREKLKEETLGKCVLVQQPSSSCKRSSFGYPDGFQKELIFPNFVQTATSYSWNASGTAINHSNAMCFALLQKRVGEFTLQQSPEDKTSEKKPMAEHDGNKYSVYKLADLPLRPLKPGLVTEVYVSHCNSPSSFFIQMTKDRDNISLVSKLVSQSSDAPLVDLKKLQSDDLVNAEHPKNTSWYRAVVRSKPGNGTVHVEFIDFGNEATIPSLKVKQIDKQCLEYPRFSIHCILGGITKANNKETWCDEVKLMFKKATTGNSEKKLACTFIKEIGSVWEVSLEDEGIVFEHSVKAYQTVRADASHLFSGVSTIPLLYKKPCISQNQTLDVYASSITGPNYFWCQHANSEELDRISSIAQEFGKLELQDSILMDTLSSRSPCLALFEEDNRWYRAQVIHKTDNLFTVLFVDYGNESKVDLKAMKSIPPLLLDSAPQAFLCSLDGFEQSKGIWDDNAVDGFYQLIVDKSLKVKVQNMDDNMENPTPQYQVKVECADHVINDLMRSNWCCYDLQVISKPFECTVSNETLNLSEYKCPTQETNPKWNSTELSVMDGSPTIKQHSEDNMAVRRICYDGLAGVSMFHPKSLQARHSLPGAPVFSIHCSLNGLLDNQDKNFEQNLLQFKKYVNSEKKITCKFIQETGTTWEVCFIDQNDILTDSQNLCCSASESNPLDKKIPSSGSVPSQSKGAHRKHATQLQFREPDVFLGQTLDVYASSIAGPEYFWCQYANSEELCEISKLCQDIGNAKQKDTVPRFILNPGSPCLALFSEDEQWYRAQISKCDKIITVVFVDYGNESEIDLKSLKSLPIQLLELPPQAFLCSLNGFESSKGSWNDNAIDRFYELLADKPLKVTIQKIDCNNELPIPQYEVKAECEKLVVNDFMKKLCGGSFPAESQSEEMSDCCSGNWKKPMVESAY